MENHDLPNPKFLKHGYIQVYTGNGKCKTTSSIGLAARALGQNWKVLVMQFCKNLDDCGEYKCLSRNNKNLVYKTCGSKNFPWKNNTTDDDITLNKAGWQYVVNNYKKFDLIILDELNIAIDLEIISLDEVLQFLKNKLSSIEIVITGRNARQEIIDIAHLVTEMTPIKHYFDIGVKSRKGIEH